VALWPNSSFAKPVGSFLEPVPTPGVDPLSGRCVSIRFNEAWLQVIAGALQQLVLQTTWQGSAEEVALAQAQAMNLILSLDAAVPGDCAPPDTPQFNGEYEPDMNLCDNLRFNNGVLQANCCGEWTDIPGQSSQGNPVANQPGAGAPVPQPGVAKIYCGGIDGPNQWLLPVPVNAGDTLEFHQLQGAWNDSAEIIWNCPDGWVYALGACGQTLPHGSPDPLPTALHMQIVALIDGNWYDPLQVDIGTGNPTVWTVPSGISNAQVLLQGNIDDIARQQGAITFCVTVTNNQTPTWTQVFDFTTSPNAFVTNDLGFSAGTWVPGQGWQQTEYTAPGPDGTDNYFGTTIARSFAATHIDTVEADYTYVFGDHSTGTDFGNELYADTGALDTQHQPATGDGSHSFTATPNATLTKLGVLVVCSIAPTGTPSPEGTALITKMTVTGKGVNPFI